MKYQVYLEKTGEIKEGGNGSVAVFQLDGWRGINSTPGKNYRYILQGLGAIKVSTCSGTIDARREIDFGVITSIASPGVVGTCDLTVTATKSPACHAGSKLGVALIFSAPGGGVVENNTALDMGNGTYFSIREKGVKVAFETPVKFWDNVQSGNQFQATYQTELNVKNTLQMGTASKSIILNVNSR